MSSPDPFAPPREAPPTEVGAEADDAATRPSQLTQVTRLARAHRRTVAIFGLQLALAFGYVALVAAYRAALSPGLLDAIETGLFVGLVGLAVGLAVALVQLARALGWGWVATALIVLALPVSGLNLLVVLLVINAANRRLKAAGLRVGFLGVRTAELDRWRRSAG